jgi:hypothetical protein
VVKEDAMSQKQLYPVQNKFIIKPGADGSPPLNGFIFEFYNSTGTAGIVFGGGSEMLENATSAGSIIWTGQDAWQAHMPVVRLNWGETHWMWDFYPNADMQYHNVYSEFINAGHRSWVQGLASLNRIGPAGCPSKVNGLTADEI